MVDLSYSAFKPLPKPYTNCASCKVRKLALFQGVPHDQLSWTQRYREVQYAVAAKQQLYIENMRQHYAFTLYSGWVALYKTMNDGSRQILKFALPGDLLGFNFVRNGMSTHSAEAITNVELCAFPVDGITSMIKAQPEVAARLVEMNARDMAICQQHLVCAGKKDARMRLAYLLLETEHRVRRQSRVDYDEKSNSIFFPVTQEIIGDTLGLTSVHVNRMLKTLTSESLLKCRHRRLSILNRKRLSEIAQFDPEMLQGHPL